ncbi:MAG: choice-of-anchor D domain-containing protein [Burkholderiales bacterium]
MALRKLKGLAVLLVTGMAQAQDARRGAELYMQLPGGVASCVSCHGPEPQGNRNSLLKAANNPQALTKALATVGVMSYIRASLDETGINDLAAFLGAVNVASAPDTGLLMFPLTADFGTLGLGAASGPQRFVLLNRGSVPVNLFNLSVTGGGYNLTHQCPSSLASGASCTASITFLASATGQFAGALQVSSSASATPLVAALASKVNPTTGGELVWSPEPQPLDFGNGNPSSAPTTRTLTLVNGGITPVTLGAAPLVFGSATLTGQNTAPFSVSGCAAGLVLAPSSHCQMTLRYAAGSPAPSQGLLQIRSSGKNPPSLQLRAAGEAAAVPPPPSSPTPTPTPDAGSGGGAMTAFPSSLLWLSGIAAAALALGRRQRPRVGQNTRGVS